MTAPARRLGLVGGECTGKSTLALALNAALGGCLVEEVLREFVNTRGRPPTSDEQAGIMRTQQHREDRIARACPSGIVIADPAVLMTAIYSITYFDDDSLVDAAVASTANYDLLIWCGIDVPWEPDGPQRDGPEYRLREHEIVGRIVAERLLPTGIAVLPVTGPLDQRLEAARRAWQPGPPQPPT